MLQLVRANSPYTVIILFILTLGLKFQILGHPMLPAPDVHQALFGGVVHLLERLWGASSMAFTLLAVVLTFGQSLYLREIAIRHRLFGKPSYLPAFVYIIASSLHPALGYFSAPLLVNWLLLAALDTVLSFASREDQPRAIFNAGFLLSCAALVLFPAVAYFVLLLLALKFLRPFRPREWFVAVLGYLVPFYFAVCLLYLGNAVPLVKSWPASGVSLPQHFKGNAYLPGLLTGCIVLVGFGIYSLPRILHRLPATSRQGWSAVVTAICLAVPACIFTPRTEAAAWMGAVPALTLLVVPAMVPEKRSRFATFTFYFLIVLVLYCQLTLRP